ncbi:hypothetical protein EDD85DRAFT_1026405 [Armillaria nabsnona]|nr:hypothetical protein EDD85DRAFT_1026405 [Armillaria nabsnona]
MDVPTPSFPPLIYIIPSSRLICYDEGGWPQSCCVMAPSCVILFIFCHKASCFSDHTFHLAIAGAVREYSWWGFTKAAEHGRGSVVTNLRAPTTNKTTFLPFALVFLRFLIISPDSVSANDTITERVISRADLLEFAPDHTQTSFYIRHSYQRHDVMKLPRKSVRTSVFLDPSMSDASFPANSPNQDSRRRVLSANASTDVTTDLRNDSDYHGNASDLCSLRLSTEDKLISPRPLGATHILVIVDATEVPETVLRKHTAAPALCSDVN